ncbi:MAG: hypothetical protein M5U34_34185 [Chloroflexi bacterium]|nr:hypothetical protein [Chloroflexota bacterium]
MPQDVIQTLIDKTDKVAPGQFSWKIQYLFFARHGFTLEAQILAQTKNAILVTLSQIENDMQRWLYEQKAKH